MNEESDGKSLKNDFYYLSFLLLDFKSVFERE